jgi:RimJ/RimL family protein N-acetyltransferase
VVDGVASAYRPPSASLWLAGPPNVASLLGGRCLNLCVFTPIHTDRLVIRPVVASDVDALHARRNDPEVARWQTWTLPWPREKAETMVAEVMAMEGPANDDWWMATIVEAATDEVVGDLAVNLTWDSRCSEVGYTLARQHWGKGYAAEATAAIIEYLFERVGVTRVAGSLHPDNPASAMVLERCGLVFEGHTRLSFWVGDDNSDDWIYGMTRADWEAWRDRPRTAPVDVRLVDVTPENEPEVSRLRTHKTQERFVAPMAASFTDALFPEVVDGAPVVPWMRAIEADGTIVGFVMLALATAHHPDPYLWRLLIDRMHQQRGIGRRAMDLVEDECRSMGDKALFTSWVEGKGSPAGFYERRGYEPTGRIVDGETEGRKVLI